MSTNESDFSRDLPSTPPQYPEPPERPRSSGCGTCITVFLIACVVLVAVCGVGAYLIYRNIKAIGTKFAREAAVAVIEDLDLPPEEKHEVIAQIDRVVDEYKAGRITLESNRFSTGCTTLTDVIWTIRPQPRSIIPGMTRPQILTAFSNTRR